MSAATFLCASAQYASSSLLASGKWVKIETPADGIYQISYSDLRQMGFSDPSQVQVYGLGATGMAAIYNSIAPYADDITPTATLHSDSKILFYGTGVSTVKSNRFTGDENYISTVANYYDTHSYYFLSDCKGVADIPSIPATRGSSQPMSAHICVAWDEEEVFSPTGGGCGFLGPKQNAGDLYSSTFTVRNYAVNDPVINRGSFLYLFGISTRETAEFAIVFPDEIEPIYTQNKKPRALTDSGTDVFTYASGYSNFNPENLPDGDYTFSVRVPQCSFSMCAPDRTVLRYPRLNKVDAVSPSIVMNMVSTANKSGQEILFPDASTSDLKVWNIDDLANVYELPTAASGANRVAVLDRTTSRLVAFDPALQFPSPIVAGEPDCANYHAASTPDMLIIATPEVMAEAEELAAIHRQFQGLDVLVVDHNSLFDEFSQGSRNPMAYRRIAKMFYDRDPSRFRYLLMMGAAYFDARGILTDADLRNRLIPYEQDRWELWNNYVFNYANDGFFGMLDDAYDHDNMHLTPLDIAVGRISTTTSIQAKNYVDKVRQRFENPIPASVFNHILLTAGSGDKGIHTTHQQEVDASMREASDKFRIEHEYYSLYTDVSQRKNITDKVADHLREGVGYFAYSGHGANVFIESWNCSQALATEYEHLPLVMLSSCDQFRFDTLHNGLIETMISAPAGGAIGGVAASRSVYIAYNQLACLYLGKAYASALPGATIGDIFRNSRNMAISDYKNGVITLSAATAAFRNLLCYNLAGDPAVPAGVPEAAGSITAVDGEAVSDEAVVTVSPMMPMTVEGSITDAAGNPDPSFNGSVSVVFFEGEKTVKTANIDNEDGFAASDVTSEAMLASFDATVTDGRFSLSLNVPVPSYQAERNRIRIFARSNNGLTAAGTFNGLCIDTEIGGDLPEEMLVAPVILSLTASEADFPHALSTASCTINATIDPSPSGIVYTSGDLGSASRAMVDRITMMSNLSKYTRKAADGSVSLALPVEGLSEGNHTVELIIVNNAGKSARATVDFTASRTTPAPALNIHKDVVRGELEFNLSDASTGTLIVSDSRGNTVARAENVAFPYVWDLCGTDGLPVASGHYKASVLVDEKGYHSHSTCEFVIVHE